MLACSRSWVAGTWGRLISANIDRESLLEASTFSSQWVVTWRPCRSATWTWWLVPRATSGVFITGKRNFSVIYGTTKFYWLILLRIDVFIIFLKIKSTTKQVRRLCGMTGMASDRGGGKGLGPDSKVHRILELHWNSTLTDHQIHWFVAKKSKPVFLLVSPYRTDDGRSSL
jgi:hypothetical protein